MILNFEDELGERHFQFCFVGFVLGGSLEPKKGMQVLRTEVALFEKFESISDLKPCGKKMITGEPERQLKENGSRQVRIDVTEFDLLYNYMSQVPWHTGTPAKNALEAIEWLQASSKKNG